MVWNSLIIGKKLQICSISSNSTPETVFLIQSSFIPDGALCYNTARKEARSSLWQHWKPQAVANLDYQLINWCREPLGSWVQHISVCTHEGVSREDELRRDPLSEVLAPSPIWWFWWDKAGKRKHQWLKYSSSVSWMPWSELAGFHHDRWKLLEL